MTGRSVTNLKLQSFPSLSFSYAAYDVRAAARWSHLPPCERQVLGSAALNLQVIFASNHAPVDTWIQLFDEARRPTSGQVICPPPPPRRQHLARNLIGP